jgi:hypothetical protein
MYVVITNIGSFITSDSRNIVLNKLRENRKWKYNLEQYMRRNISKEEEQDILLDDIFFENQKVFVED